VCCGFLSPLKIHRLGRVFNPQPLGPVASTLTTTPPRQHFTFSNAELNDKELKMKQTNYIRQGT
jgi:hypothetical protein